MEKLGGRCVVPARDVLLGHEQAREAYVAEQKKEGRDVKPNQAKTVGRMAVVLDPDLNHVGLIQVAPDAKRHFGVDDGSLEIDKREAEAFKAAKKLSDRLEKAGVLPEI